MLEAGPGRAGAGCARTNNDVRVDRVGMEQVVLHAADDAAEGRDVAAQHAIEVHAPQLVRHAGGRAQEVEEQPVIARVLAELLVDQPQVTRPSRRMVVARTPRIAPGSCIEDGTARGSPTDCGRRRRRAVTSR